MIGNKSPKDHRGNLVASSFVAKAASKNDLWNEDCSKITYTPGGPNSAVFIEASKNCESVSPLFL